MKKPDNNFEKFISLTITPWFFLTWVLLMTLSYFFADVRIAVFMNAIKDPLTLHVAQIVTYFGGGMAAFYITFLVLVFLATKFIWKNAKIAEESLFIWLSIVASGIICDIIKIIAGRARPIELFSHSHYGFDFFQHTARMWSFPSGHSATIAALMMAMSFLWSKFSPLFLLAMLLVAGSRLVVSAHYLSDIMAGIYLGTAVTVYIFRVMQKKNLLSSN